MKKFNLVCGVIVTVLNEKTKKGGDYAVYQIESINQKGEKMLGKVMDFEGKKMAVGQSVIIPVHEDVQIFKEKISVTYRTVKEEYEKDILSALGIRKDFIPEEKESKKVKL